MTFYHYRQTQLNKSTKMTLRDPLSLLLTLLTLLTLTTAIDLPTFREAPAFRNADTCPPPTDPTSTIHIAMTLDATYLRGSIAAIFSALRHSSCPENLAFHLLTSRTHRTSLSKTISSTFPSTPFSLLSFNPSPVRSLISSSIRRALDNPLNYARIYLPDLLPPHITRILYLDSDVILVNDVASLYTIELNDHVLGAPEYCHANFSSYFTSKFWSTPYLNATFAKLPRPPCYFNTGVMVIDLTKWRNGGYTIILESWMRLQKKQRIYTLGSLPPFLLVFAGRVEPVAHEWNQHGLGGDNIRGLCRKLHPGKVSLLHWSGKGKPWLRIDAGRPCPIDTLWEPYDLMVSSKDERVEALLL